MTESESEGTVWKNDSVMSEKVLVNNGRREIIEFISNSSPRPLLEETASLILSGRFRRKRRAYRIRKVLRDIGKIFKLDLPVHR